MELRSALTEAKTTNGPIVREGLHVVGRQRRHRVHAARPARPRRAPDRVLPARALRIEGLARVVRGRARARRRPRRRRRPDAAWLRQELASTKQYLQSIVDEQEAASQELRAAHEEVLSSNEELQSTNEELETTKEELQSANEELTTVNEQFHEPQPRARRADRRPVELHQQRGSADGHRRARSAHPPADARGPEGLQPAADRRRAIARAHQVLARGRRHRRDHRPGDRPRCSRGSAMSAIATAGGGCCACCRSAPATTASTARRSWPWTST